jgi:hypothetical protein
MSIPLKDLRILYQRSGNRCAFPSCDKELVQPESPPDNPVASSEVAHIVGTKGPRSTYPLPEEERDRYGNLILLCEEHHHLVDALEQDYPVEKLRQIKEDHEALITDATGRAVAQRVEKKESQPYKTEVLHSSLLPVSRLPKYVLSIPCDYNDAEEKKAAQELVSPFEDGVIYPFIIRGGRLICFRNLRDSSGPFEKLVSGRKVARDLSSEWWNGDENLRSWFVTLLNRSLNKLTGRHRLNLDKAHHRYFFEPLKPGQPLEITYHPLNQRSASRFVVWQPVTRISGVPKNFWYHLAVSLKFHQVSSDGWCLSIRPELRVTRDGKTPIDAADIGSKVTKKAARTFNHDLLGDLQFWRDYLSDGLPRIVLRFDDHETLVISTSLMRCDVNWPGMPAEFAQAFKNIDFPENLFSITELAELSAAQNDYDEWDEEDQEDQEDEDDE